MKHHEKHHDLLMNGPRVPERLLRLFTSITSCRNCADAKICKITHGGISSDVQAIIRILKNLPPLTTSGFTEYLKRKHLEMQTYAVIGPSKNNLSGLVIAQIVPQDWPIAKYPKTPTTSPRESRLVLVGIEYIWVAPYRRRRRIASDLVDVVRSSLVSGVSFSRSQVSFRFPSESCTAFASSYAETPNYWVHSSGT